MPADVARAGGPPSPTNLTATVEAGSIVLNWMPGSSAAKEFRVYRLTGTNAAAVRRIAAVQSAPLTFRDITVVGGTTYTYFVAGVDDHGTQGSPSNMVAVTAR